MVVLGLYVSVEFENVSELSIEPDHNWILDIKESDGFEERSNITLNANEIIDTGNSRNSVHFCITFKDTKKRGTITLKNVKDIVKDKITQSNTFTCISAFDCRGLDILSWTPAGGYNVVCGSGFKINNIEFEDDSWAGYDEDSQECASILNLKYEFRTL